jgi:hypothetical protein
MDITSVSDFLAKCFSGPHYKRKKAAVFYHGTSEIFPRETRHIPSLYYPPNEFYKNEERIFYEILSIFPDETRPQRTTIEKLILMKHYNIPTRIMDISKNALISLFFACFADKGQEKSMEKDGIVSVYTVPEEDISFCDSDSVTILANIAKRQESFKCDITMPLKEFNSQGPIQQLLNDIRQDKAGFAPEIDPHTINSVLCLRPSMNNPRIIRQDGYFFLFGIKGEKKNCADMPPEWIGEPIIIPAKYKKSILKELDAMGINEGFVYPDFDHVNNVLRRRYGIQ